MGNWDYVNWNDNLDQQFTIAAANELNQYRTVDSDGYYYDANGNLEAINIGDDGGTDEYTYTYDPQNRLISAVNPAYALITYKYDAAGRRIEKNVDGTITKYVYDGSQVIAEYDSGGTLLRKYIYGPSFDEPICMIIPTGQTGAGTYWYHYDGLGSVVALSKYNGTLGYAEIVERYSYDAFGVTTIKNASNQVISVSAFGNPYMFTGRRYDPETGLYYYRARMYAPTIGRFLQPDPIGYADSMNLYGYVRNNSINYVDPSGLFRFGHRALNSTGGRVVWYAHNAMLLNDFQLTSLMGDAINLGIYHEQGFFEDGTHENVGYFGPVTDPVTGAKTDVWVLLQLNSVAENPARFKYEISPWRYDDSVMRQAMQNVNSSGDFDPEDYKLMGSGKNNCQDYAKALKKEYKRLGGKVKFRPFKRRSKF